MKSSYLIALFLSLSFFSFSAPVNTVIVNNGSWSQTTTWDLGRLPTNGDTVVIPQNITLVLDNNLNMSSQNIYLKIYGVLNLKVGKLDLGANSTIVIYTTGSINNINGNNSERIQIGGVTKYSGSEGTLIGPSYASSATGTSPNGFSVFNPLPVNFLGFSVASQGSDVIVQWATSEEINAFQYQVERSYDGASWTVIARINAAGNSFSINKYTYTDKTAGSKTVYYRVKEIDIDGKFFYTGIRSTVLQLSPNDIKILAVQNKLVLQFPQSIKNGVSVRVVSLIGQVVREQRIEQAYGQVILNVGVSGNYIIFLSNGQDFHLARQIIF